MILLGLDPLDKSLARTPERIAKMYVDEVFSGLDPSAFPDVSFFEDDFNYSEQSSTVFSRTGFTSFCEHHFVPFVGVACVAFIPNGKLIGLSKIPRIVRYYSKRPQLQERLTAQIADTMALLLGTEDVAVCVQAKHLCVLARGVEDRLSLTVTQTLRGAFGSEAGAREEFLENVRRAADSARFEI